MALSSWMAENLEACIDDMTEVAENLNSARGPCCQDKATFLVWHDQEEGRLHKRVVAVVAKIESILSEYHKVAGGRMSATEAQTESLYNRLQGGDV
jgi:hypothetical protein